MDAQTFQAETLRIERLLYHVAYSALGSGSECADFVQEAILRAWKNRRGLRNEGAFKSWMVRILLHTISDSLRKKRPLRVMQAFAPPRRWVGTSWARLCTWCGIYRFQNGFCGCPRVSGERKPAPWNRA